MSPAHSGKSRTVAPNSFPEHQDKHLLCPVPNSDFLCLLPGSRNLNKEMGQLSSLVCASSYSKLSRSQQPEAQGHFTLLACTRHSWPPLSSLLSDTLCSSTPLFSKLKNAEGPSMVILNLGGKHRKISPSLRPERLPIVVQVSQGYIASRKKTRKKMIKRRGRGGEEDGEEAK